MKLADFETFEPSKGFRVYVHPTPKFKTISLAVYLHQPLGDDATSIALLPFVLRRGCRGFPPAGFRGGGFRGGGFHR